MASKKSGGGFFEGLLKDMAFIGAIEASRNSKGKSDPYIAAGLAYGALGDLTLNEHLRLGMYLGIDGAFDDDDVDFAARMNAKRKAEYISIEHRNYLVDMKNLFLRAPESFPQFMLRNYVTRLHDFAVSELASIDRMTNAGFLQIAPKAQTLMNAFTDAVERHDAIIDNLGELQKILEDIVENNSPEYIQKRSPDLQKVVDAIKSRLKNDPVDPEMKEFLKGAQSLIDGTDIAETPVNIPKVVTPGINKTKQKTIPKAPADYLDELKSMLDCLPEGYGADIDEKHANRMQYLVNMIKSEYVQNTMPSEIAELINKAQQIIDRN